MMRKRFRGQAGRPVPASRLARAQRGAVAMGMMAFTGRQPRMTQRDLRAGTAMGMMAATGKRFRNQIGGGSTPTCPYIGELFWDIAGGQGVIHPVYNAWREQRTANGQSTEPIFWAQETGCYPTMGNYASNGNVVVAQWGGQNDYITNADIQEALAIYEASLVSGATSGATSGKKPSVSKRPRSSSVMKSVTGRDECGFVRQSGAVSYEGVNCDNIAELGLDEVLNCLASGGYSLQSGTGFDSSTDLLSALANQTTAPFGSVTNIPSGSGSFLDNFLDALADPNDISSGEFGGVDSLLDDLQTYSLQSDDGYIPVMSGGGDGMPPPVDFSDGSEITPVMSGGGDGMPPPPVMSGGGDGMPPPPVMSGGGDGMPPPPPAPIKKPVRRPKPSRIARTLSGLI